MIFFASDAPTCIAPGGVWVAMRLAQWDSQVPWATANSRFLDAFGEGRVGGLFEKSRHRTQCLKWLVGGGFGVFVSFFIFFYFSTYFWVKKWSDVMITLSGTTLFERRGVSFLFLEELVDRLSLQLLLSLFLVWGVELHVATFMNFSLSRLLSFFVVNLSFFLVHSPKPGKISAQKCPKHISKLNKNSFHSEVSEWIFLMFLFFMP